MGKNIYYKTLKENLGDFNKWEYAGGNKGRHNNYFKIKFEYPTLPPPEENKCMCGHSIVEQCYIYNNETEELKVLGNCCIRKFIPKSGRTCEDCGDPHKNRKWNKCKDCVKYICFDCGTDCNSNYKYCYDCYDSKYIF